MFLLVCWNNLHEYVSNGVMSWQISRRFLSRRKLFSPRVLEKENEAVGKLMLKVEMEREREKDFVGSWLYKPTSRNWAYNTRLGPFVDNQTAVIYVLLVFLLAVIKNEISQKLYMNPQVSRRLTISNITKVTLNPNYFGK